VPELPELEVIRDRLRLALAGRVALGAEVRSPACLKTADPPLEAIKENHVRSVSRRGKFTCIALEGNLNLCIHLMRSGRFAFGPAAAPLTRAHAFALHLDRDEDLRIVEAGTHHQVAVHLVRRPEEVDWIARAGLDPMAPEFTLARFRAALGRRGHTLKRFLTDQNLVAGVGNCYSDEILFAARLSPFKLTSALRTEEQIRLYTATKKVLQDAILALKPLDRLPGRSDRTFLKVHDRLDQPCPACGTPVKRVSFSESTLYYCPHCQTGGEELADRRFSKFLR
jgi:formamidopyrimidine-DNA glycosylase